jgi:O-antigen/teichoic acid export membrane protein
MSSEALLDTTEDVHDRQRRGTLQLLAGRSAVFVSAYVVSAVLARQLGPAAYGVYGVIASQLLWLEMVVHAGIPTSTAQLMAGGRHDAADIERSARTLLVGVSIVLVVVGWTIAPAVATVMRIPDGAWLFRIAILDVPFAAAFVAYEGVLNARHRYGRLARALLVLAVLKIAGVGALTVVGVSTAGALVALVLSTGASAAFMASSYSIRGFRVSPAIVAGMMRLAGPLAFCLISGQVLVNLDLWLLKSLWTGNADVVGQYVASLNLARTLVVIPTVQAGVLFSSVTWAIAAGDEARVAGHVREASRFAIVIAAAVCVILGMNGAELLSLLFSRAYAEGQRFLPIQLAGFGLFAVLDVFANALMASGRRSVVAAVLTAVVPVLWISNLLLIPRVGPVGAAMSMIIGVALATAVTGTLTARRFGAPIGAATVGRVLVACVVVGVASMAIPIVGRLILVKLALLGLLFLATLYALGEITSRDFGRPSGNPRPLHS